MRALIVALSLTTLACGSAPEQIAAPGPLRVCSDPNNLPFSNERRQGFENALASMLADDMRTTVEYTWWAQRRGFLRNTLSAGRCDIVMGYPSRADGVATTAPYYRSTYVFVSQRARHLTIQSLDDPALRSLRIGVQIIGDDGANSPPAHALSRRGIIENIVGYTVYGDYGTDSPPSAIVTAVANGDIDVAAVWGPLAGYFASRQPESLDLVPVQPQIDVSQPQVFDISMAVRRDDVARLQYLDEFIARHRGDIAHLLARYHVPLVPRS